MLYMLFTYVISANKDFLTFSKIKLSFHFFIIIITFKIITLD